MASTPDPRVHAFGAAVRIRREKLGLSQEALGYKAKVHRTYVSDIERGARNPTVKVIWKLAEALDRVDTSLRAGASPRRQSGRSRRMQLPRHGAGSQSRHPDGEMS